MTDAQRLVLACVTSPRTSREVALARWPHQPKVGLADRILEDLRRRGMVETCDGGRRWRATLVGMEALR